MFGKMLNCIERDKLGEFNLKKAENLDLEYVLRTMKTIYTV